MSRNYQILLYTIAIITIPSIIIGTLKDTVDIIAYLQVGERVVIDKRSTENKKLYECRDAPKLSSLDLQNLSEKDIARYVVDLHAAYKSCKTAVEVYKPQIPDKETK